MLPNVLTVAATMASTSSALVTSVGTGSTWLPLSCSISRAVFASSCLLRAPIVTWAPSAARAAALARPSPLLAAKTSATLPLSPRSIASLPLVLFRWLHPDSFLFTGSSGDNQFHVEKNNAPLLEVYDIV